VPLTGRHPALF